MKVVKPCPVCTRSRTTYERTLNQIDLVRCVNCGFVYANVPVDLIIENNLHYGDEESNAYDERQTFLDRIWFNIITNSLTLGRETGRVVDIGCGNGQLLRQFVDRGWDATGVDPSPWAAQFATKYGYELYASVLENSGMVSDYFDVVTNTSTLEHIPHPREHLKEVIRILRPGGTAFFSGMPNYGSLLVRGNVSPFRFNTPPGHVNYFTPEALRYLLNEPEIKANLFNVRIRAYGIPGLFWAYYMGLKPLTLIRRSLKGNKSAPRSATSDYHLPLWKYRLGYMINRFFYHVGRPFGLGDKLEVVIVKAK